MNVTPRFECELLPPVRQKLSKLLREQEALVADDAHPLAIEQNNKEVWALRNKYACGSTWGKDPAFDKWWVKQVAKARNLNVIRQIFSYAAIAAIAIFFIVDSARQREYYRTHPDTEEVESDNN
jgi:hypothetical protein